MTYWQEKLKSVHCGYNEPRSVAWFIEKLKDHPLSDEDLSYFKDIIEASSKTQTGYDRFPDEGGIDIAALLLANSMVKKK